MKLLLASNNSKKIKEMTHICADLGYELVKQSDFAISEAVEDGLSFVENAIIKARHAALATNLPTIADDSGIEVDALDGKPGIYSARFAGEHASDEANLEKLVHEMSEQTLRTARYRCVIVMMRHAHDPMPIIAQGTWEGEIIQERRGNEGFGYDPIFLVKGSDRTAAELSAEEKAKVSHRGQALRQFHEELARLNG